MGKPKVKNKQNFNEGNHEVCFGRCVKEHQAWMEQEGGEEDGKNRELCCTKQRKRFEFLHKHFVQFTEFLLKVKVNACTSVTLWL